MHLIKFLFSSLQLPVITISVIACCELVGALFFPFAHSSFCHSRAPKEEKELFEYLCNRKTFRPANFLQFQLNNFLPFLLSPFSILPHFATL